MKPEEIINGRQVVSLVSESNTAISLTLQDTRTGEVKHVDITADMAVLPDEALLNVTVSDVREPVLNLAEWWQRGDILTEDEVPTTVSDCEPEAVWTVTPDGQEVDLRAHEGGLF